MDLDWTQASAGPVTLVRARLRNERATDRRVRLRNCLDGPVLSPRHNGIPEPGWDPAGVTTVVPAGGTVALGYASPAEQVDPPLAIAEVGPATERTETEPSDAVRELGDPRPPRDVLDDDERSDPWSGDSDSASLPRLQNEGDSDGDVAVDAGNTAAIDGCREATNDDPGDLLTDYRNRIRTAEALSAVGVPEATILLEAGDGLAGVDALAARLDRDARDLRALASVATALAVRAEAATLPTDALRRLS
ncbi:MAG: hypothetical protein ACOCQU_00865 [Halolamina sp.]